MGTVTLLPAREDNPAIVCLLEDALAMARRGEVSAVAVAMVQPGGELAFHRVENGRWAALLASVESLKFEMMMEAERG